MTRNIRIVPDHISLSSATHAESYDVLILPGGAPGAKTFSNTDEVLQLIASFRAQGKYVAAICAGTTALVAAQKLAASSKTESGASRKVKVTSHPSVRDEIEKAGWEYSEERIVVDDKVITSRGYVGTVSNTVPCCACCRLLTLLQTRYGNVVRTYNCRGTGRKRKEK